MTLRLGNWMLTDGDLYRVIATGSDGSPILANWSRPRLEWLRCVARRAFS